MKKLSALCITLALAFQPLRRSPAAAWEERMAWDRLICP